jgi:GNAT superfamily N-acetyltransferase
MATSIHNIISMIPTQSEIQFLEDRIYEYNVAKINSENGKLFCKLIHDPINNIIAGITGWTWAKACEITLLWVSQDCRNKGYGQSLLNAAEAEARKENCTIIFLRTYSFQAPNFYLKNNFKVEHEITNFPHGHSSFCFIKRLDQNQ